MYVCVYNKYYFSYYTHTIYFYCVVTLSWMFFLNNYKSSNISNSYALAVTTLFTNPSSLCSFSSSP